MAWSIFHQTAITPAAYAKAILSGLGAPQTTANVQSLIAWMLNEAGGGTYNPLNTTLQTSQTTGVLAGNTAGVKNYASPAAGVAATVSTLNENYYPAIRAALMSGKGLDQGSGQISSELYTWSGTGYTAIAGNWSQAAQYLGGSGTIPTTLTSSPGPSSTTPMKSPGPDGIPAPSQTTTPSGQGGTYASTVDWKSGLIKGFETPWKWTYDSTVGPIANAVQGTAGIVDGISQAVDALNKIGALFAYLFRPSFWLRVGAFVVGAVALFEGVHFLKLSLETDQ